MVDRLVLDCGLTMALRSGGRVSSTNFSVKAGSISGVVSCSSLLTDSQKASLLLWQGPLNGLLCSGWGSQAIGSRASPTYGYGQPDTTWLGVARVSLLQTGRNSESANALPGTSFTVVQAPFLPSQRKRGRAGSRAAGCQMSC